MLAKAKIFRGIEFISVSELPGDQQLLLQHSRDPERIKILMDGKILSNCIQYHEYCKWYIAVFKQSIVPVQPEIVHKELFPVSVALNKA
jgi:hypothetical protein